MSVMLWHNDAVKRLTGGGSANCRPLLFFVEAYLDTRRRAAEAIQQKIEAASAPASCRSLLPPHLAGGLSI